MKKTLWTKNFTLVTAASALGAVGGIAGGFALSFLVFDETGSTLASALILAIQLVPFFVLPLFLAPVMDRLPRKPFLVAGDLIDGVLYALMGLYLLKFEFSYAAYLGYSLLLACLESFDELAFQSIYPKLIPEGMEQKGYAVSTTLYPILRVLMLPLAGILLDAVGAAWILIGQGGLSLLAALIESNIDITEHRREGGEAVHPPPVARGHKRSGRIPEKRPRCDRDILIYGGHKRSRKRLFLDTRRVLSDVSGLHGGDVFAVFGVRVRGADARRRGAVQAEDRQGEKIRLHVSGVPDL